MKPQIWVQVLGLILMTLAIGMMGHWFLFPDRPHPSEWLVGGIFTVGAAAAIPHVALGVVKHAAKLTPWKK